jgi:subtilisin-like proprotein convertase family protein
MMVCIIFTQTNAWSATTETPVAIAEVKVDLPIPDADTEGVSHTITITGSDPLESIETALQIDHAAPDQLVITLTSPSGNSVILHNRNASDAVPFSPIYESINPAAESLSTFIGSNPKGDWILNIADYVEGQTGFLTAWGLRVSPDSLIQPPPLTPVPLQEDMYELAATLIVDSTITYAASADSNDDGLDDLFILSETSDKVLLYFSNGAELSKPPLTYEVDNPQRIALDDLNNDGRLDFVIASQDQSVSVVTITVFLGNTAGGFSKGFTSQVNTYLDDLTIFDVTNDEIADIIVGGAPHLVEGVGDGSFKPAVPLVHLGQSFLAHGDINADGEEDFYVTISRGGTSSNNDPYILFGSEDISFPQRNMVAFNDEPSDSFASNLLATDSIQFISILEPNEDRPHYIINTISESETGEITIAEIHASTEVLSLPVKPIDINGDGLDELIYLSDTGIQAYQYSNNESGGVSTELFQKQNPQKIVPGNFYANDSVGLAVITSISEIMLLRSTSGALPTPTPFTEPTPIPTQFLFPTPISRTPTPIPPTPTPVSPAGINPDINGDGRVDRLDLLLLMKHWGQEIEQ